MATLAELLAEKTAGLVWLLDISFDDFATVSYRWSTASTSISGNEYDGRIASITPVTRGFGRDHLPAASTTKLRISNSDFAADWLIDRTTVATQVLQARFRLTAHLYESRAYTGSDLNGVSQVIGFFNCLSQPELMDAAIDLVLADDSLGRLAETDTTPTVREWLAAESLLYYATGNPVAAMDWDVPLPLVFGLGAFNVQVPCYKATAQYAQFEEIAIYENGSPKPSVGVRTFPLVVCATRAGNYSGSTEITRLQGTFRDDVGEVPEARGITIEIPRSFRLVLPNTTIDLEIWRPKRSVNITKGGKSWQVVYIDFNVDYYVSWFLQENYDMNGLDPKGGRLAHGWVPTSTGEAADQRSRSRILGAFAGFRCNGSPLSVMSTRPVPTDEDNLGPSLLLTDHIYDLIAFYSKASPVDIDTDAFTRAAKARSNIFGAGIVQPARPRPMVSDVRYGWVTPNPRDGITGILRAALGEMCGTCDADLFMTKEGLYSISTSVFDYEAVTGARVDVDEARTQRVRIRTPSQGERWAPYNRVNLIGPGGAPFGPFDNQDAIDEWGVVLPVTLQAKWDARLWGEGAATGASTVWNYRTLESKVRPAIRFLADRAYLALELGDYFTFTATRGGAGSIFSGTIFKLEAQRIDPLTLSVELEAIWADDLATDSPFLLDDEEFLVRIDSDTAGESATVENDNDRVTFGAMDPEAEGVLEGDILVLLDSTQDTNVFTRYRELRIGEVTSTDIAILGDQDFDAPSPTSVATWKITRGKQTYPTSASDPTNYPNGGAFYGKCCDENDLYGDNTAANKLMDG